MSTLSRCGNINSKLVSVSVSSVGMGAYMGNTIRLNHVMVIPNIPARYPNHEIDVQRYPHLAGLPIQVLGKDFRVDMFQTPHPEHRFGLHVTVFVFSLP